MRSKIITQRGHSKAVLLTLLDRKPRFFWAYLVKDQTVSAVNEELSKFIVTFKGPTHSLAVNRGTEFSGLNVFETQYGIKTYYCHAYSPAERGGNERFKRILRYFYPEGTCFEHVSARELNTTLLEINQRPFKVLNWQEIYNRLLEKSIEDF